MRKVDLLRIYCWILLTPIVLAVYKRITSGLTVSIVDYPYQVSLEFDGVSRCSGALISFNKVLTAGHCLRKRRLWVRCGSDTITVGGQLVRVSHVQLHPMFKFGYDYDIAVLTLAENLTRTTTCAPVHLSNNTEDGNRTSWISGWGRMKRKGLTKKLNAIDVHEISRSKCQKVYGSLFTKRMICFGDEKENKGSCVGDSGGPLVDKEAFELIGINSWGAKCDSVKYPGVYTRVALFYNWILDEIDRDQLFADDYMSATPRIISNLYTHSLIFFLYFF